MTVQSNLFVRSMSGDKQLPIGKVVQFEGKWIVHCWVYAEYQRHTQDAWGLRASLLLWMVEHDVEHIYFWDNGAKITHGMTVTTARLYGTPGKVDQFGGTLNVPTERWTCRNGAMKVPWVPIENHTLLPAVAVPWPLPELPIPKIDTSVRHPSYVPKTETLSLPW